MWWRRLWRELSFQGFRYDRFQPFVPVVRKVGRGEIGKLFLADRMTKEGVQDNGFNIGPLLGRDNFLTLADHEVGKGCRLKRLSAWCEFLPVGLRLHQPCPLLGVG